jgi:hypothetical protein
VFYFILYDIITPAHICCGINLKNIESWVKVWDYDQGFIGLGVVFNPGPDPKPNPNLNLIL